MARTDFTLLLDLQDYFSDYRQHSKIHINRNYSKISDLEDKISELFGIKFFYLLSGGHFLPSSEDIALLKNEETVSVKPNIPQSKSVLLADTYYDTNNTNCKRMTLSESIKLPKYKRRKKAFGHDEQVGEEAVSMIVEQKKNIVSTNIDSFQDNGCRLHMSTPNTSIISNITKKKKFKIQEEEECPSYESNNQAIKSKKRKYKELKQESAPHIQEVKEYPPYESNGQAIKSKKSEYKELKQESSLVESAPHIQEVKECPVYESNNHVIKSKKKKRKELKQEFSLIESTPHIGSELSNQKCSKEKSENSHSDLLQNHELKTDKTSLVTDDNEYYSQTIPYKKAKRSWTPLPLPKLTNIVKILRIPVERIEIDDSRFVYTPNDNLPPLGVIDTEMKSTNNSAREPDEEFQCESLNSAVESQNHYEKQYNAKSMNSERFPDESKQAESNGSFETAEHKSQVILLHNSSDILSQTKLQECLEQQQPMSAAICGTSKEEITSHRYPDESLHNMEFTKSQDLNHKQSQNYFDPKHDSQLIMNSPGVSPSKFSHSDDFSQLEQLSVKSKQFDHPQDSQQTVSHNHRSESQQIELPNFFHELRQVMESQKGLDDENIELAQVQKYPNESKCLQKCSDIPQQTSQQTKQQNSSELMTVMEQLEKSTSSSFFEDIISELSQGDLKESRSKSRERWRERWRLKIDHHTRDSQSSLNLNTNSTDTLKNTSLCHNSLCNKKSDISETISDERQATKNDEKNSPEIGTAKYEEFLSEEPLKSNEAIQFTDRTECCETNIPNEDTKPTDDLGEDSVMSYETVTDISDFSESKRRRRKRKRKPKKVKTVLPIQENVNFYPTKWLTSAKPKIHIKFPSSDDETQPEGKGHEVAVADLSATHGEKIKILQDVTINPDAHCLINCVESEEGGGSTSQDNLIPDEHPKTDSDPSGFSKNDSDYFGKLLQLKKEELLRTVDSIISIEEQENIQT